MIRIRLATADINTGLKQAPEVEVRYHEGGFTVVKRFGWLEVTARAYFDLRGSHVRLAIPFNELGTAHTGHLLGSVTAMIWPKWVEPWLEKTVGDQLSAHGLPWDLVWIDTVDDPDRGRIGTINLSPRTLNDWLRKQNFIGELAPRLVGLHVEPDALVVVVDVVERGEAAPAWRGSPTQPAPPPAAPDRRADVADGENSSVHIGAEAINRLLDHFVNSKPGMSAKYVDGRIEAVANGLAITVYEVALNESGLDVRLGIGEAPAGAATAEFGEQG